eukprot:scaffold54654_cov69-Phaeocystis_antarctica.AAC.1
MTTSASPGPSTAVDATIATATNAMRCRECLMRHRAHPARASSLYNCRALRLRHLLGLLPARRTSPARRRRACRALPTGWV